MTCAMYPANATAILSGQLDGDAGATAPPPGKCMICDLLLNLLNFFNDAVIGGATEQAVRDALKKLCDEHPIVLGSACGPLLQGNVLDVIFQALRDSLSGVYKAVGEGTLGCPTPDDITNLC
ncbi:hypothetical protein AAVH_01651 [Aphelenchoides avenae]|nr:hypothetical protein AAVH_01651 [Aphelenchus avenae]